MFADDLLLYKTIYTVQDYLDLQADVDALAEWLVDYKLTLNVKKCKSLLISRKKSSFVLSCPPISINNSALEAVLSYRYLGVLTRGGLSWSNHINSISSEWDSQSLRMRSCFVWDSSCMERKVREVIHSIVYRDSTIFFCFPG